MPRFSKGVERVDDDSEGDVEDGELWEDVGVSGESGGVLWGDDGCRW